MHLYQNLKKIREFKDYKQGYMAEKMGITQPVYSEIENGIEELKYSHLEKIAEIFDMKPEDIIKFDVERIILFITNNSNYSGNLGDVQGNNCNHQNNENNNELLIKQLMNIVEQFTKKI